MPATDSAFDQANVAGARTLLGVLYRELDALPFPEQLKYGTADRTTMKEVLHATLVPNEPEPLVDQQPCDCAG
jgi:hypothetical protein